MLNVPPKGTFIKGWVPKLALLGSVRTYKRWELVAVLRSLGYTTGRDCGTPGSLLFLLFTLWLME
jgi:hypothetical protein